MSRRAAAAVASSIALLLTASPPSGADVDSLYDEYRSRGLVRGCDHSATELREGLAEIPADIRAYDPGFADALNAALQQRAASCGGATAPIPTLPVSPGGGVVAVDGSPGPAGTRSVPTPPPAPDEEDDGWPQALLLGLSGGAGLAAAALAVGVGSRRRPPGA